jgi:serine/threonine protein kinase
MELVRGEKITDYCDQQKLDIRRRLALFIQICHAVQHAHHKGIIHRDIKPSNILVTTDNGAPAPKVIDFGIAKAITGERLADNTIFTACEQFIGTPAYMSPEQAQMERMDVDTRSDIYSLGVLLYELLTGHTPFDGKALIQSGMEELRRTLREKEPPRPSVMLRALPAEDLAAVAQRRGIDEGAGEGSRAAVCDGPRDGDGPRAPPQWRGGAGVPARADVPHEKMGAAQQGDVRRGDGGSVGIVRGVRPLDVVFPPGTGCPPGSRTGKE